VQIALISDIHGNLPALDAVLDNLARRGVGQLVCLGDVAAGGPQPRQVVRRLREIRCPVVMGNADAWLLDPQLALPTGLFAQRCQDIDLWCAHQLDEDDRDFLRAFPATVELPLGDAGALLGYHGSPRSFREPLLPTTPDETLDQALAGTSARFLAGGHTHLQMFRRYREWLLLNPGSVGVAMDRTAPLDAVRNPPWAEYAVVTAGGRHDLGVALCRVQFDVDGFRDVTLCSGMPHAEWSASEWVRD